MKTNCSQTLATVALAFGLGASSIQAAAPASPQGLITGKEFAGITGTAVANLTGNAKFPDNPDNIFFFPYFEWNATGDIVTAPGNYSDNYGGQIVGYFYPPSTGDYVFFLAADDNAVLYLSTDSDPANKALIAQETAWSNFREYIVSGGGSDLDAKDSSFFTGTEWPTLSFFGGAQITLQAGRPYYIEALFKEGTGGDNLSVAVQDPGFQIFFDEPIPGQYLATDRTSGPASVASQPQSQTVDERGSVTLSVLADGTPPYTYQWRKDGANISGATELTYTIDSAAVTDNNAKYSVVITGAQGSATSDDAVLTVTPDAVSPTVIGAKGSPNLTEVVLTYSEPLDEASATDSSNYQITRDSGTLAVNSASLSGNGTQVTLTTAQQTLGTKYTIRISNVEDTAATPNVIAENSKAVLFPTGKLVEMDGFIVYEAENYDRNLDGLWSRDTERGNPSGGASMVVYNGTPGDSEGSTKLEYDVEIQTTGTWIIWYHASGNDGSDDSAWFHLNGARPVERANANDAAMTGFSGAMDFEWNADSFGGADPMSVEILTPGTHALGLAVREDGSYFDKFVLTQDDTYTPSGLGPPETRQGAPGLPSASLAAPADGATFNAGASVTLEVNASGQSGLLIDRVEYTANGEVIGEATADPLSFTWNNVPDGIFAIRARAFDEIGQIATSDPVTITVGTPPPQALLVVGTDSDPDLNAADAGIKARLESQGWQVQVVQAPQSVTGDADGKQLVIASATINSGDLGDKMRLVPVPVLNWEQAVQDNFLMTLNTDGVDRGTLGDQTDLDIIDANHPLAAGLSTGVKTVSTQPLPFSWGAPNQNATIVATVAGNPDQALIYGYEEGAILADDVTPAPARRVMFFYGNDGFDANTDEALALFDAAVEWASGLAPQAPAPTLSIVRTVSGLNVTFTGTLQSAGAVTGPWADEAGAASPLAVTPDQAMKFYRAKE